MQSQNLNVWYSILCIHVCLDFCFISDFFREDENSGDLVVEIKELGDLLGHTAELIGTNVNANPYSRFYTPVFNMHALEIRLSSFLVLFMV